LNVICIEFYIIGRMRSKSASLINKLEEERRQCVFLQFK